jgi:hypothetical protein
LSFLPGRQGEGQDIVLLLDEGATGKGWTKIAAGDPLVRMAGRNPPAIGIVERAAIDSAIEGCVGVVLYPKTHPESIGSGVLEKLLRPLLVGEGPGCQADLSKVREGSGGIAKRTGRGERGPDGDAKEGRGAGEGKFRAETVFRQGWGEGTVRLCG